MALIGKIEKKKGNMATILIKKTMPCEDNCRNCSAGCKLFSIHIQTQVDNNLKKGDFVKVQQKGDAVLNYGIIQYTLPAILLIGSIIIVQLLPQIQSKGPSTAVAVVVSAITSQFGIKIYDKMHMKKNAVYFIIGEKLSPQ